MFQELSSGDRTTAPGSPDDMFLNDLNPCLTPYAKSKSKVHTILGSTPNFSFFLCVVFNIQECLQCRSLKPLNTILHHSITITITQQGVMRLGLALTVESCQKVLVINNMSTLPIQARTLVADRMKTNTHMVLVVSICATRPNPCL